MAVPENIQEGPIRDPVGIVVYLDCLGMISELIVAGILLRAAGIAHPCANHAVHAPEPGVGAPESAQGKGGRLKYLRHLSIYDWNSYIQSYSVVPLIHCALLIKALNNDRRNNDTNQGKYKRQSGGRGQYGDVWLKLEPLGRGEEFQFENKIVGGVVPSKYIPSVEKGVVDAMKDGFLAGYRVVDVKVTLYDGTFHEVDSGEH